MSRGFNKSLLALSVTGLLISPLANATNGYFAHGYSTKEKALAGAGVAHSQDAMAAANNPAGLVNVGDRMDVGAAIFNPNRGYTVTGAPSAVVGTFGLTPGSVDSAQEYFFIPHFGYSKKLDDTSAFGVAAYGNGGMNTNYKSSAAPAGTFYGGPTGVNLAQLFINASYAKQLNSDHSVGASLIFAYQMFKSSGLAAFGGFSADNTKLTNNGDDTSTGFGAKIGWQGKVAPEVTLGASYQTKMSMSEFDDYAGLFAEQGDFDIPATLSLGAAWDIDDKRTLVVDVQTIYYSDVASIANPMSKLLVDGQPFGAANGPGFGWEDMTVVKIGYEWDQNDMTWRVGLSNGSQPIPESEVMFNMLAPGIMETHLTFGFTMAMGSNAEFSLAGMYAPSNDVTGANPMEVPNQQTIKLEMDQMEVQATYSMKF
ncbi:MAG: outer membrane protein transport protein [Gammaproteobacteria bacterium]|nr:outer membrane protein transport protein [Gammaproteobacteria bacterium]